MIDREELLRTKGKVAAPDGFTKGTIRKIERITKIREVIEFIFLVWSQFLIFLFEVISKFFRSGKKSKA